jgi:hypothetical protein
MVKLVSNLRSIVDHDGAVILNNARNQITTLDAMGGYIWHRLECGMTQKEIVCKLVEETGADVLTVEHDVQEFLEDLTSRSLLTGITVGQRRMGGL